MIWDSFTRPFVYIRKRLNKRPMPQTAGFIACLFQRERPNDYLLVLFCYPLQLEMQVKEHVKWLSSIHFLPGQGALQTPEPLLCDKDKLFVHLSGAFIVQPEYTEKLFLQ